MSTKIEWTDETWNPVSGCSKVSAGCTHCYAERLWPRLSAKNMPYEGRKFTDVKYHSERLSQPLHWRKPRLVFVNSMSDLFHPDVPDELIVLVFSIMNKTPQHTYQILTKRPERMRDLCNQLPIAPNAWLGVSIEDQATADERIPLLLEIPAAIRFVSAEPLLGSVNLGDIARSTMDSECWLDWVIVGGESGSKARPMHPEWVGSIRDYCITSAIPFFFKQWGEWAPRKYGGDGAEDWQWVEHGEPWQWMCRVGKRRAGRELMHRTWSEMPR